MQGGAFLPSSVHGPRVIAATPRFRSGRCLEMVGSGVQDRASQTIYVARFPAPRRRSCPTGGGGIRARSLGQGPELAGSSPSRATEARPIRRRRPPRHPVHDPGSREGDARDYAGASKTVGRLRPHILLIKQNQQLAWRAPKNYPRSSKHGCSLSARTRNWSCVISRFRSRHAKITIGTMMPK
jgi:hypothetical protein